MREPLLTDALLTYHEVFPGIRIDWSAEQLLTQCSLSRALVLLLNPLYGGHIIFTLSDVTDDEVLYHLTTHQMQSSF